MSAPTVVSLFAGCGGSSLGYRSAGFACRLAVEHDAQAADTYRANFPGVAVFEGDVRELTGERALAAAGLAQGELGVMDGSPPCQGFSLSGSRRWDDPRNQLWREYARLLEAFRPRAFVFENVGGLVLGKMRLVFAEIMKALRAVGYAADARVLSSARYGVAQVRRRLFIVGVRADLGVLPSWPAATSGNIAVADALRGVEVDQAEREMLLQEGRKRSAYAEHSFIGYGAKLDRLIGASFGWSARKIDPLRPVPTITRNDGAIGMYGMMHWQERRRLTLAEARALSGFPATFAFPGGWEHGMHQMGNCVPPPLAAAVARELVRTVPGLA